MIPVSPVLPGSESFEVVLGKNQPEYLPLPTVMLKSASAPVVTRWRFTDEEREAIAAGADLIMTQLTLGHPFQPVHMQITAQGAMPETFRF